jgi:hypothetical protein
MNGWIIIKKAAFHFFSLIGRIGNGIARHYDRQLNSMVRSKCTEIDRALRQAAVRLGQRVPNRRIEDPG